VKMTRSLLALLLGCLAASALHAQKYEVTVGGAYWRLKNTNLGSNNTNDAKDDDTSIKGKNGFGVRATLNTKGYYGHEIMFGQSRADVSTTIRETVDKATVSTVFTDRVKITHGAYDFLMYMMPRDEWWRPFIAVGANYQKYGAPNIAAWTTGATGNIGFNYGGGIKLKFSNVLMRLDVRDYIGGKPYDLSFSSFSQIGSGRVRQMEFSAGIGIGF